MLEVFVLTWISAGPDAATSRAQELPRTTIALQTFNPSATVWDNNFSKIISTTPSTLPVVPAVESHLQQDTDCFTVWCSGESLVTSNTTLETQALFYDGGIRTITVTSVSGSSCASRFSSCWNSNTATGNCVACISNSCSESLSDALHTLVETRWHSSKPKWSRLITFFVVHFRASAEGITKV